MARCIDGPYSRENTSAGGTHRHVSRNRRFTRANVVPLARQIELVELQTGDTDPKTNFRLIIIQTELERFKFLVRSFLRTRIAKVPISFVAISSQLIMLPRLTGPRSITMLSTSSATPSSDHVSPLRRFNTRVRISRFCMCTIAPRFSRSFRHHCSGWMIRPEGTI